MGNFDKIFQKYDVGQVIYSPCTKANATYANFIQSVKEKGCSYRNPVEGESWKVGDAIVTVVYLSLIHICLASVREFTLAVQSKPSTSKYK